MSAIPAYRRRARIVRFGNLAINLIIGAVALFPILWGVSSSFKPANQILEYPPRFIPTEPVLEHYVRIFQESAGYYLLNSLIVSAGAVGIALLLGAAGAYALTRFRFWGRSAVLVLMIAIMSIPIDSLLVPTYSMMSMVGLIDTRASLVLLYAAYQLPIVLWMLCGYFESLPVEIENAARIDGYGPLAVLFKIVLPLSKPGLVAAGLFVLVFAWNDFVVALVMTSSEAVRTFPVATYFYLGFYGREWGPLLAASVLAIAPILGIFIFLQRYFLSGLTGGSVKG